MAAAVPGALEKRSASEVLEAAGEPASVVARRFKPLDEQLREAGLEPLGNCRHLCEYGAGLLRTSPLLQDLTPEEAAILGGAMVFVRAEPGQDIIREGESGDWMMLLLKGTVDVTRHVEVLVDGQPVDVLPPHRTAAGDTHPEEPHNSKTVVSRVAVLRPGAAFGEMSMLDSEPRDASCTAIEAVEAGVLGRYAIALLIRDHPAVGAKLLVKITQLMAQRLRNTSNRLIRLLKKK